MFAETWVKLNEKRLEVGTSKSPFNLNLKNYNIRIALRAGASHRIILITIKSSLYLDKYSFITLRCFLIRYDEKLSIDKYSRKIYVIN